jgi:hypothetical protein
VIVKQKPVRVRPSAHLSEDLRGVELYIRSISRSVILPFVPLSMRGINREVWEERRETVSKMLRSNYAMKEIEGKKTKNMGSILGLRSCDRSRYYAHAEHLPMSILPRFLRAGNSSSWLYTRIVQIKVKVTNNICYM